MSVTEIVLDQLNPSTPKCGLRNNYNGVVIVQAVESTGNKAKIAARGRAKTVALNALNTIRTNRTCPAACGANPTYEGDVNPQVQPAAQVVAVEDPGRSVFVAYAWAKWRRAAKCPGTAAQQDQWQAGSEVKLLRYAVDAPACGTTRAFTGCVLARAYDDDQADAKARARQAAIDAATQPPPTNPQGQGPLIEDRRRQCPQACQPGQVVGTDPSTLSAVDILDVPIFQWVGDPHVAYAFVKWDVTITCPVPPPPPEDDEGGGGQSGGMFFSRTKPARRKAAVKRSTRKNSSGRKASKKVLKPKTSKRSTSKLSKRRTPNPPSRTRKRRAS
jgi:hypothetical protein